MNPDIKLAAADPGVHDLIRRRWSPRAFSDRPVSTGDLLLLFDAARWAPSCFNEQPWRFLLTRNPSPEHSRLLDCLAQSNQLWAGRAPVLLLMAGKRAFTQNGAPNLYALHDTGMALAFLMLQATALGLHVHAMAGFDREKARAAFAIPDDYEVGAVVVAGYLGDPETLSPRHRESERAARTRKPLADILFADDWEKPAAL